MLFFCVCCNKLSSIGSISFITSGGVSSRSIEALCVSHGSRGEEGKLGSPQVSGRPSWENVLNKRALIRAHTLASIRVTILMAAAHYMDEVCHGSRCGKEK